MHAYTSIMKRLMKSLSSPRNAGVHMEMSLWSPSTLQVSSCTLSTHGACKAVPASQAESKYSCLEKQDSFSWSKDKDHLLLALFEPQKKKAVSHSLQRKMVAHISPGPQGIFCLHLKSSRLLHEFLSQYLIDYCCYNSS